MKSLAETGISDRHCEGFAAKKLLHGSTRSNPVMQL